MDSIRFESSVLFVEDEEPIRQAVRKLLTLEGYRVETARNGKEALLLLDEGLRPGLILLDLMMPEMDAFEFRRIQEMDARFATIPIVVMSAARDVDLKSLRMGIADHLRKPVDLEVLLQMVEKHLSRPPPIKTQTLSA